MLDPLLNAVHTILHCVCPLRVLLSVAESKDCEQLVSCLQVAAAAVSGLASAFGLHRSLCGSATDASRPIYTENWKLQ